MIIEDIISILADYVLFISCLLILLGSIFITFKMRFVQLRLIPMLIKMLKTSLSMRKSDEGQHTVLPHKALLTAMSTTLGISTIVAPVIAINLGGPGALFGFLLTAFFGSAATFIEVNLTIKHRKKLESGVIMGGPMQYLKDLLSAKMAKWYAVCCVILMAVWSGAQANQLAAILDSPLLGDYRTPTIITGSILVILTIFTLMGGIKRISAFSSKLVPIMFVLYIGSCFWIVGSNLDRLEAIFSHMFSSFFEPTALSSGVLVGGIVSALRWGVFKGTQTSEAGIGTQSIPHSMSSSADPIAQGTLAMLSTYTAGFVAFLSGCVALITETWQDETLPLGISMVAASFKIYFSYFGIAIVTVSAILFGFGTILGNSFNGTQCYYYLTNNKKAWIYYGVIASMVLLGSVLDTRLVWSLVDFVLAAMALPHMTALILYAIKSTKTEVVSLEIT